MRTITRTEAIADLRAVLVRMADEQSSVCRVVTWRRLFCRGFAQWSGSELDRRFPVLRHYGSIARGHQELVANDAQLERQDLRTGRLPCDVEAGCADAPCNGWAQFDERELARFHRELCGEKVRVVRDPDGMLHGPGNV